MPIIGKHHVHPYSNAWALKGGCGGASGGRWGNRLVNQHLPHACFRRISPQRFLVSRFVAKTRPAFRSLWRESGMAAVTSAERKWTEAGIPLSDALSGDDRQPDYDLRRERPLLYLRGVLVPVETEQQNQMPPPSQNGPSRSRPGKKAGALRYIMRMRASPTTPATTTASVASAGTISAFARPIPPALTIPSQPLQTCPFRTDRPLVLLAAWPR